MPLSSVYTGKVYCKTAPKTACDSIFGCTHLGYLAGFSANRSNLSFVALLKVPEVSAANVTVVCGMTGSFVIHFANVK